MKLQFNSNQIKRETAKAVYVELKIDGQEFNFWAPSKFVRDIGGARVSLWFPNLSWTFGDHTAADIAAALDNDEGNYISLVA